MVLQESKEKYSIPLYLWLAKHNSPSWSIAQIIKNRLYMWKEKPLKHYSGLLFYTPAMFPVLLWRSVPGKWCTVIHQLWFLQQQCFSPWSTPSAALARFNTALLIRCEQIRSVKLCLGETRNCRFCQALTWKQALLDSQPNFHLKKPKIMTKKLRSLAFSILGICLHHLSPDSSFQSPLR